MFAIVETGGKQYKVQEGDTLEVELLDKDKIKNNTYKLEKVLLINDKEVHLGKPFIEGAYVNAKVLEKFDSDKVIIFKKNKKKQYKRKLEHIQKLHRIEIDKIILKSESKTTGKNTEEEVEVKAKKTTVKKAAPKPETKIKSETAKEAPAKKTAAKKAAPKPETKTKSETVKKAPAKKTAAKKVAPKSETKTKSETVKKAPAKKTVAKKAAPKSETKKKTTAKTEPKK